MYNKIMLYLSYSDYDARAAALALELAEQHEAELHIIIAPPLPPAFSYQQAGYSEQVRDELINHQFQVVIAATRRGIISVADRLRSDSPRAILGKANKTGCDLIVLGAEQPGLWSYLFGSLAARLKRTATCTVLVVGDTIDLGELSEAELGHKDL